MERLHIPYPIIVEGKYDRLALDRVTDAAVYTTDGFGIFKNTEKQALFRALAQKTPVIVLTDPDGAGGVIRSRLSGMIPADRLIRLYVPRIAGKEARKAAPSAEGILGVEGMQTELLRGLLQKYAQEAPLPTGRRITPADLYEDGYTGHPDSAARRDALAARLSLPSGMNAKAFCTALNFLLTYGEYRLALDAAVSSPATKTP